VRYSISINKLYIFFIFFIVTFFYVLSNKFGFLSLCTFDQYSKLLNPNYYPIILNIEN